MTTANDIAIDVSDVTKRYPRARRFRDALRRRPREWSDALQGLSLQVPRGTVHGLLGANGAGKTTLLKVLATLVVPTTGSARVAGHDVVREPDGARRTLGFIVAEERSFYWRLSGRDNLMFFAALHDMHGAERKSRVEEVLGIVGLEDAAGRAYREYSSGMRQRLSIARGLLARPEVLLMDEPTRALDPPSAAWIRTFVRETLARDAGTTVLVATHDMLEAETTCDRLSLVEAGRIVASGTPQELKAPLDRAARTRIVVLPPHEGVRASLPSDAEVETGPAGELHVTVAGGPADVAERVAAIVRAGGRVSAAEQRDADLATLFARLAGAGLRDGDVA